MKKTLCYFIALSAGLCACLCAVGCSGEAAVQFTLSDDGKHYIVSGVTGSKTSLHRYEIPETYSADGGDALPVTEIGDGAFYGCYYLTYVSIPDGVTKIGNYAFAKCVLSTVEIPDSVTEIGYSAFAECSALKTVTMPDSVTSLGDRAFMDCSSLTRVEVLAQITDLKYRTFYNTVISADSDVYYNTSLTEIVLPATLQKIEQSALAGNNITDIYFMGTEEQWKAVYFYTTETDENGETVETKIADDDIGKSDKDLTVGNATVHCNYTVE